MRLLVQGIGSIGQRHYRNARSLGHEVAILRTSSVERPFVKEFFEAERTAGNEPQIFLSLEEAIASFNPEAVIVCTPNHLHLEGALAAAKLGLNLLIEKPVHNEEAGLDELEALVAEKQLVAVVGYNLRFHPLLARVKELVDTKAIGDVVSASVEVGENIEDWHPWEDYRDTYAPYVESGGGSLLCFSHDIDYLYWLLGAPDGIAAAGGKVTPLSGDAEDLVQSLWKYNDGRTALLHIDYWQRPKVRTLKLIGTAQTLRWDAYGALTIWDHVSGEERVERVPDGFERNDMFISELNHFIACIAGREESQVPLREGREVVRIIDRMKSELV